MFLSNCETDLLHSVSLAMGMARSDWGGFNNAEVIRNRDHPIQAESGSSKQFAILLNAAFLPAVHYHHDDVDEFSLRRQVALW